jgi:hypothetical protein
MYVAPEVCLNLFRKRSGAFRRPWRPCHRCDAEDVALFHDQQLFAADIDLGARPFAEQDAIAGLHGHLDQFAVVLARAIAAGNDFTLGGLFLGAVGDDQPASGFLFALNAANKHAVMKRFKCHVFGSLSSKLLPKRPVRAVSTHLGRVLTAHS